MVAAHYKNDDLLNCWTSSSGISGYHVDFHEGHGTIEAWQRNGMLCVNRPLASSGTEDAVTACKENGTASQLFKRKDKIRQINKINALMPLCCVGFRLQAMFGYLLSTVRSLLQIIKTTASICTVFIITPNYSFMQSNCKKPHIP